jgi:hypothetical protein
MLCDLASDYCSLVVGWTFVVIWRFCHDGDYSLLVHFYHFKLNNCFFVGRFKVGVWGYFNFSIMRRRIIKLNVLYLKVSLCIGIRVSRGDRGGRCKHGPS